MCLQSFQKKQKLDDNTLNIVHMHIHDIHDEITFDRVNLTGTDQTVQVLFQLNIPASFHPHHLF
jgi:hypothetical protein